MFRILNLWHMALPVVKATKWLFKFLRRVMYNKTRNWWNYVLMFWSKMIKVSRLSINLIKWIKFVNFMIRSIAVFPSPGERAYSGLRVEFHAFVPENRSHNFIDSFLFPEIISFSDKRSKFFVNCEEFSRRAFTLCLCSFPVYQLQRVNEIKSWNLWSFLFPLKLVRGRRKRSSWKIVYFCSLELGLLWNVEYLRILFL